jgi:hypothetical protein
MTVGARKGEYRKGDRLLCEVLEVLERWLEPFRGAWRVLALAAPPAQVTEYDTEDDDQHCGNAIPGNDRPWIAGINVADDPVPGKHDPQHDQGGNYQAPLAG